MISIFYHSRVGKTTTEVAFKFPSIVLEPNIRDPNFRVADNPRSDLIEYFECDGNFTPAIHPWRSTFTCPESGRIMWARVKGRTENALLQMPFKSADMFRPGYIQPLLLFPKYGQRGAFELSYAMRKTSRCELSGHRQVVRHD